MEKETGNQPVKQGDVNGSNLSDDEMDGTSEICEPKGCLYCDMDGPWRNGLHVIGCPNGTLS